MNDTERELLTMMGQYSRDAGYFYGVAEGTADELDRMLARSAEIHRIDIVDLVTRIRAALERKS